MDCFLSTLSSPVELNKILSTWTRFSVLFCLLDLNARDGCELDFSSRNSGKGDVEGRGLSEQ